MSRQYERTITSPRGGVLDPQVKQFLENLEKANLPTLESMTPVQARDFAIKSCEQLGLPLEKVASIENIIIPGPAGEIPIRIYTPECEKHFPVLVYFHGGGWVIDNLDTHDNVCRSLCKGAACVVVSVDYRLAPENKFPAAVEDCYSATKWVADNAIVFNGDPSRIAVGGDSAGGNLAAVVSLMSRDKGSPFLIYQLLIYPVTNLSTFHTESYRSYAAGYFLTKADMAWFRGLYLNKKRDAFNPQVSPLLAKDLSRSVPALVITCELDVLRDEGESYARRLGEASVKVKLVRYNGMIHAFFNFVGMFDQSRIAMNATCSSLREAFRK